VLVCVKILNANYYEKEPDKNLSWWTRMKNSFMSIFSLEDDSNYNWNLRVEDDRTYA
jgi:hypothetical protein